MKLASADKPTLEIRSPCCNATLVASATRPVRATRIREVTKEEYLSNRDILGQTISDGYDALAVYDRDGSAYCYSSFRSPAEVIVLICYACEGQYHVEAGVLFDMDEPLNENT